MRVLAYPVNRAPIDSPMNEELIEAAHLSSSVISRYEL